jgi:hypothetical protein
MSTRQISSVAPKNATVFSIPCSKMDIDKVLQFQKWNYCEMAMVRWKEAAASQRISFYFSAL